MIFHIGTFNLQTVLLGRNGLDLLFNSSSNLFHTQLVYEATETDVNWSFQHSSSAYLAVLDNDQQGVKFKETDGNSLNNVENSLKIMKKEQGNISQFVSSISSKVEHLIQLLSQIEALIKVYLIKYSI